MRSFLKSRMLWHYCTGAMTIPVKGASEEDAVFLSRMIEWDSHNHMILTWIRNTSIPSISNLLGSFDDAKSAWDMLTKRYSTTHGSMKYQLVVELHQLRQEPGQSINDYYDQLRFIWDQIDLSDPIWECSKDAQQYASIRDEFRLYEFLMSLHKDFEPIRGQLLNRSPAPSLDTAVNELVREEARLATLQAQNKLNILAITPSTPLIEQPQQLGDFSGSNNRRKQNNKKSICNLLLFSSTIFRLGYTASPYDSALFLRRTDKGTILLLLYVDDMIITGDDLSGIQELKDFLSQQFEMKDLGHLSYFLGLEITHSTDGLYITQAKYASDLLSQAGLTDSKTVDTPVELNAHLTPLGGKPLSNPSLYRRLVGSLVYLTVTRPDISYAVHQVSQYLSAPRSTHYAVVLRILRYLKGTLFHGLFYSAQSPLILRAFSDADWAGDPTDRRSTTGYCFLLGSSLISWRSKKQTFVARSSTEAEYRALADTTSELLWLRWLLKDLGVSTSSATPLYCDNQSAIHIAHNDVFHERTKHIEIDCHFIRYHLLHGALKLFSVSSKDQLADIFTKSLPKRRTRDLVDNLKLVSHPP
ncbi:hypothetical protein VitviT2T_029468 [Vitis vinifera]|uniref:Reverse transcriptase Ty1/copia-type domain-containing protein n=1 Tax=Vitis vinifera TaxID=29760 RepID=A0ABY9DY44_VITVI|nr:hypothetical protein VitviT2T_029468 [Vitis vinifera]